MSRRSRRLEKAKLEGVISEYETLRERCGSQLYDAISELEAFDISYAEFSSEEFDCRVCPQFMTCSLAQYFDDHPRQWNFKWLHDYEQEQRKRKIDDGKQA